MRLVKMIISNYRQFENAELNFDKGITVLAGANNSGKTSLITLIKEIFHEETMEYKESDIPAKNMHQWIDKVYPLFEDYFYQKGESENIEDKLVEIIIPKDQNLPRTVINTTEVKVHVSYDPTQDDIKLFADYIMDLDEEQNAFYFLYTFEISRLKFIKNILSEFEKLKRRFAELEEAKGKLSEESTDKEKYNIELKERYLKQMIVRLYVKSIVPVCHFCDRDFQNKCEFDNVKEFRKLFNFCFIKASRPLDDDESDHSHMLSKQMIKMAKLDEKWNELIQKLPDELLIPIQEKEIDKTVRDTSLSSLKDTIDALEKTSGTQSGELMLDMQVTEEDISDLLQRITTATYNVDGYYLGEASQGLGYSNMIYIHLQLKEYEKNIDPLKVNIFFVEEPESHMHPQMQQVFVKYLIDYYQEKLQGLITTHSNEMVRVAGLSHLRVIRRAGKFNSDLYDPSILLMELKKSKEQDDKELADFFDWFFEIGYSELIFADKAIFYEGDTERLYIRKLLTLEKYQNLKQQYIAYIQVGGAYAKNYQRLIQLLKIKSLIITDIDYGKGEVVVSNVLKSETTNATIKKFYKDCYAEENPSVEKIYAWKEAKENILDNLIYVCFQTDKDGYARTLEEAMLSKYFSIGVSQSYTVKEWKEKRKDSKLDFSIPQKKNGNQVSEDEKITLRDILMSSSGQKTNFMYSVIINEYVERMEPDYIRGGLEWLMS